MAALRSMKAVTPSQSTRWSSMNSNMLCTAGTALLSKHVPYVYAILSAKNSCLEQGAHAELRREGMGPCHGTVQPHLSCSCRAQADGVKELPGSALSPSCCGVLIRMLSDGHP